MLVPGVHVCTFKSSPVDEREEKEWRGGGEGGATDFAQSLPTHFESKAHEENQVTHFIMYGRPGKHSKGALLWDSS